MKTLKYLALSLLIISAIACRQVCENVKVGEVEYSIEGKKFFNYSQGQIVTFQNLEGQTIDFTVDFQEEIYFICQKVTCDPLDPYKSSFCEYIESPQNSILLVSDSILMSLTVAMQSYEVESDLIYEYVKFTLSHKNDSAVASYISDVRFEEPSFEKSKITDIDAFVEERSSISMNDQTFSNILLCEDEKLSLVYQKEKGFVAFKIEDGIYTLK